MKKKNTKRRGRDSFEPRKIYIDGEIYWQIHFPRTWDQKKNAWVRKRRTARDYEEAKTIADQARIKAKNDGVKSFAIPDDVRRDALAAVKELEPFGATILEAAKFYSNHLRQQTASQKVSVAVEEFLAARGKDELRPKYLEDLRYRLNRFSRAFGDRTLASLSAGEIGEWLRAFKPFNRNTFRLRLSALFAYAVDRGWCSSNPIAKIKKVKAHSQIGIIEPEQFARILETAGQETLPYWLLGGFGGLRRAEISRLEWRDIRFDSGLIEVPALKSKTASRRFVKIQPNLAAWLEPYRVRTGKVCPPNLRKRLEADRANAGLKSWSANGLRHSFASYHLAHFQDAARIALELGHTDQELLFRHYRELVTPEQGAKWWRILPAEQTNLMAISA